MLSPAMRREKKLKYAKNRKYIKRVIHSYGKYLQIISNGIFCEMWQRKSAVVELYVIELFKKPFPLTKYLLYK